MRLIIHAPFIYTGGGKTLLEALVGAVASTRESGTRVLATVDARLSASAFRQAGVEIMACVNGSLQSWLHAEHVLARTARAGDVVLCFASLPPLFRTPGFVVTYVQNAYVVSTDRGVRLSLRQRMPIWLQRVWLKGTKHHTDLFVVQTQHMKDRLVRQGGVDPDRCRVLPFVPAGVNGSAGHEPAIPKLWDFVFVSEPWPHKNHRCLVEAFVLLAQQGLTPSLALTVKQEKAPELAAWIDECRRRHGLAVANLGQLDSGQVADLYRASRACIFPSLSESLGLPLLEAERHGLPIIAAERDYVRDVITPAETFDPESPRSIMRAVMRHLGKAEQQPRIPGAEGFLADVLRLAEQARAYNEKVV